MFVDSNLFPERSAHIPPSDYAFDLNRDRSSDFGALELETQRAGEIKDIIAKSTNSLCGYRCKSK